LTVLGGRGGAMAETQQELETEVVKKKLPASARYDWMRQYEAETGLGPWGSPKNPPRKAGAERLRKAADKRVGTNSAKLADLLMKKALAGDMVSAKMLIALAEAKKPEPPKKRKGPTVAQWWAAQPQWKGPPAEYEDDDDPVDDGDDDAGVEGVGTEGAGTP